MKKLLLTNLAAVMVLGNAITAAEAQIAKTNDSWGPIRIGVIMPRTGNSSDMGNSAVMGAQIAVNEINEVGGYMGRKLELVVRDDEAKPDVGLAVSKDLVLKEKVVATIGFCNSGVALKSLEVFQENQNVLMVSCSTGTGLTTKYPADKSYIFRIAPKSNMQASFIIDDAVKRLGYKRIAIIADKTAYGDIGLKDLEDALAKNGLKPVAVERFDVGTKNLDKEIARLRDAQPDAFVGWTVSADQGTISAAKAKAHWKIPQYGDWTLSNYSAYTGSEGAVHGVRMPQTVVPNKYIERNNLFVRSYKKLAGKDAKLGSMMSGAQSYDAVHLLVRAMFQTKGDFSGPKLKHALENLEAPYYGVVTVYDRVFSNTDHDAISMNMLWMGTWNGGDRGYYYSEDDKRALSVRRKTSTDPATKNTSVAAAPTPTAVK